MIIHTGLDENYSAIMAVCPKDRLGIVVLSNINSLQFCSLTYESVMDMLENKPFPDQFSFELFLRWLPGSLAVLALVLLLFNLYRWKKYSMKIGIIFKTIAHLKINNWNRIKFCRNFTGSKILLNLNLFSFKLSTRYCNELYFNIDIRYTEFICKIFRDLFQNQRNISRLIFAE